MTSLSLTAFLVLVLVVAVTLCEQNEQAIFNGTFVESTEYHNYVISLSNPKKPYSHQCGGTILNEVTILTAAHCECDGSEQYIVAGNFNNSCTVENDSSPNCQRIQVKACERNPVYDSHRRSRHSLRNDSQIVRLMKPIVFYERALPAVISTREVMISETVQVVGWGLLDRSGDQSNMLSKTFETVVNITDSRCKYSVANFVEDYWYYQPDEYSGQICAIGKDTVSCGGDSGGPVVIIDEHNKKHATLYGIVSTTSMFQAVKKSNGKCVKGNYDIHNSVFVHRDFILKASAQFQYTWGENVAILENEATSFNKPTLLQSSYSILPYFTRIIPTYGDFTIGVSASNYLYTWGKTREYLGYPQTLAANFTFSMPQTRMYVKLAPPDQQEKDNWNTTSAVDACGGVFHTAAVSSDGKLYTWGSNSFRQADSVGDFFPVPHPVDYFTKNNIKVKSVRCGHHSTLVISDQNKAYGLGWWMSFGAYSIRTYAFPLLRNDTILDACSSYDSHYILDGSGNMYAWGNNSDGRLGLGTPAHTGYDVPTLMYTNEVKSPIVQLNCSTNNGYFVTADGSVWGWGYNKHKLFGDDENYVQIVPKLLEQIPKGAEFHAGDNFVIFKKGKEWKSMGVNDMGQLGNGMNQHSTIATSITIPPKVIPSGSSYKAPLSKLGMECKKNRCVMFETDILEISSAVSVLASFWFSLLILILV